MMYRYCLMFTITFCVSLRAGQKDGPDLAEVLSQLEKQHGSIESLAVQFQQEKRFSFMTRPIVSHGFILFAAPDRIRFDIVEPFKTSLLDDGKTVRRYEKVDGRWRSLQFGDGGSIKLVMEQIGQWMQGKFAGQKDFFTLALGDSDPDYYAVLVLEPRHTQFRRYIEKIAVYISLPPAYQVARIHIHEPKDDSFVLVFSNEKKSVNFPVDCFRDPAAVEQCLELFEPEPEPDKSAECEEEA